ncbi:MAG: RDD family protein [Candidatus Hodarchaeales archaeon]
MSTTAFNWEGYVAPGIAPRAIAIIIDLIVLAIINMVISTPIINMLMPPPPTSDYIKYLNWVSTTMPMSYGLSFLFEIIYFVIFSAYLTDGQSIGKLIMNIKVMSVDANGNFVSVKGNPVPILIRTLLYIVDCCCCGIVGYIIINGSANQQRLGDSIARTVVVRK